jgi:hypothetical protein
MTGEMTGEMTHEMTGEMSGETTMGEMTMNLPRPVTPGAESPRRACVAPDGVTTLPRRLPTPDPHAHEEGP